MEKPKLEFEVDFETQIARAYSLGRLCIGLSDGTMRIFLKPDGIHYMIPKSAMGRFVHLYEDREVEFTMLGPSPEIT